MAGKTIIDELVTILGIDVKEGTHQTIQKFRSLIEGTSRYAMYAAGALTTAASAVAYFAERSATAAGEIDKFRILTGISTQSLQAFEYAANAVGASSDALRSDLSSLTRSMSSPIPGEYNHTLFMLGVSARDASGKLKGADRLLLDIADKFERMDAATQLQWASRLGISDDTLLLLKQGRTEIARLQEQAKSIPTIVGEQQLKNARELTIQLSLVKRIMTYLSQEASSVAGPALKKVVTELINWLKANREIIQQGMSNVINGITQGFEKFWSTIQKVRKLVADTVPWLGKFFTSLTDVGIISNTVYGSLMVLVTVFSILYAKFILIATIVATVAIVFDDLMTYIDGGSSAIGMLIDKVKEMYREFREKFPGISGLIERLGPIFGKLWDIMRKIIGPAILDALKAMWGVLKLILGAVDSTLFTILSVIDKILQIAGFSVEGPDDMTNKIKSGSSEVVKGLKKGSFDWSGVVRETMNPQMPIPYKNQSMSNNVDIKIEQNIQGNNPMAVASEASRKMEFSLQQLFPGALTQVAQ